MSVFLYLAVGVPALAALRRWCGLTRGGAAILLLLPLCFTGRAMLTGRIYAPADLAYLSEPLASSPAAASVTSVANTQMSDVFAQFIPWNAALRQAITQREWPLWNPYELSGGPLAAAAQSAPYHPVTLLAGLLPLADGVTFAAAMLFLIAAIGAFVFAYDLTQSEIASLVAAAGWALTNHLATFAGTSHAQSVALIPFVLFAARRLARRPSPRTALLLGTALTMLTLCGHPESELHIVALACVYVAFELRRATRFRALIGWGLAAGAGTLLLTAFFVLPMLEAIPQTKEYASRQEWYAGRHVVATGAQLRHFLLLDFLPFADGTPGAEALEHSTDVAHGIVTSAYAGTLLFVPALFALFASRRRERWLFVGLCVFGWLAGASAPGVTTLLAHVPGFSIAINSRMITFAALGVCMLAALGIEAFLDGKPRLELACVAVAAALGIATVALAPSLLAHGLSRNFIRIGAMRAIVPLVLAAAAIIGMRAPRRAAFALLALLMLQRTGETFRTQPALPRDAFYPPLPRLESATPFRIVGLGTTLTPNIATHYALEDVRGYQAMTLARYADTYPLWCVTQPVWFNRVDDLRAPFLSLLNVRYAFAPANVPAPDGWHVARCDRGYEVLENSRVLGRAFVPATVHRGTGSPIYAMSLCNDFGREAWIDDGSHVPVDEPNGAGTIDVSRNGSQLVLRASIEQPAWVVISEPAWRGWRATENGHALKLRFADHALLAVHLDRGAHEVKLTYRPQAFVAGSAISLVTLLLTSTAGIVALRRRSARAEELAEPVGEGARG